MLKSCSKVQFESRDGIPGVCYQDTENTAAAAWTPVTSRHRKRPQLPPYVLGIEVVCRRAAEEEFVVNEVLSDHELLVSDGATTPFEGKLMSRDANLHQAIGTCVVSSFIEKSLEKLYEST